jgi:hypothetical protein
MECGRRVNLKFAVGARDSLQPLREGRAGTDELRTGRSRARGTRPLRLSVSKTHASAMLYF